jgi:class 3 adenylate cyclase
MPGDDGDDGDEKQGCSSMITHEEEHNEEVRYDAQAIQRIVSLASRLEHTHQETMTASEVEQLGADVGLDRAFVRKALAQMAEQGDTTNSAASQRNSSANRTSAAVLGSKEEFLAWLISFNIPIVHSVLAFFLGRPSPNGAVAPELFAFLALPLLLSWVPGFLTARKRAGILFGLWYATCLTVTTFLVYPHSGAGDSLMAWPTIVDWLQYAVPGTILGAIGAWLRARMSPPRWLKGSDKPTLGRQALLDQFFALQKELESHMQHRAFLSIDVVGSSDMKQAASELAVEHSFSAYRQWIEDAVRSAGGEMQSAAGDGVMCMFTRDEDAVRVAHQLQQGIASFNSLHNRLPLPFRIRCGVSAGSVAIAADTPIGHLQSPVIDRAAYLQKRAQPGSIELGAEVNS